MNGVDGAGTSTVPSDVSPNGSIGAPTPMAGSFSVERVAMFPKDAFPMQAVYGPTRAPELRLITCGGPFDGFAHSYPDNVVVFARLTAVRRS
jgi:hypothetical protein